MSEAEIRALLGAVTGERLPDAYSAKEPVCSGCESNRVAVRQAQAEWAAQQQLASYVVRGGKLRIEHGPVGFVFVSEGGTVCVGAQETVGSLEIVLAEEPPVIDQK